MMAPCISVEPTFIARTLPPLQHPARLAMTSRVQRDVAPLAPIEPVGRAIEVYPPQDRNDKHPPLG